MKRDFDNLDLRAAFREEPTECHLALMDAARSVKEEKQTMKRNPMRTLLIAAIVALSMLTTAFAAGELLGWTDYFEHYYGIHTTPAMYNAMQMNNPKTVELGPMTFTVQEAISDNRIAMISTKISVTDGSAALLAMFPEDAIGAAGDERSKVLMKLLEVEDPSMDFYQAAKMKNLPLYSVRAIIQMDEQYDGGVGAEDIMWDAQGSMFYFSKHDLNTSAVGKELPIKVFLRVTQIDPATGEELQKWTTREEMTIPVGQLLAEKTYTPDAPFKKDGAELQSIHAELYITGAYLTSTWKMPEGMVYTKDFSVWDFHKDQMLTDGSLNEFERGVSLSGSSNNDAWPIVTAEEMINVDALPEVIRVSDGTNDVIYK